MLCFADSSWCNVAVGHDSGAYSSIALSSVSSSYNSDSALSNQPMCLLKVSLATQDTPADALAAAVCWLCTGVLVPPAGAPCMLVFSNACAVYGTVYYFLLAVLLQQLVSL